MAPNGDEARRQLDRLLASALFANAGRMSRFLRFVVEQSLAGEGERLKEYVIGVEVFDRDADYDPRVDAIVRVEAARLRAKLAEYYAGEGRGDNVVVSLPKGGYAPVIRLEDHAAAGNGAPATNGTAALVPVEAATELVRDGRFGVVASSAARAAYTPGARPRDVAAALDAAVLIEARVLTSGERVTVETRASSSAEQKFWVESFAGDAADTHPLEREVAAAITARLADMKVVAD